MSGQKTERKYIRLPKSTTGAPFSDGVLVGDVLYIAGRIGVDPETGTVPDDVEQEVSLIFDGLRQVLHQSDMDASHVVSVQIACPDPAHYDAFNRAYAAFFKPPYPARAFVGSGPLVRKARFHVQAVAVR